MAPQTPNLLLATKSASFPNLHSVKDGNVAKHSVVAGTGTAGRKAAKRARKRSLAERETQSKNQKYDSSDLPVHAHATEIVTTLKDRHLVIVGHTGSGKTTQIPQLLLKQFKCIAITQPRRVACMSVAQQVAKEQQCNVGELVGYSCRFNTKQSQKTRLLFMTDGILLRMLLGDPLLSRFDCIILDEVHERSLRTDMLLGCIKLILVKRPNLRIVVMSATLDSNLFAQYFDAKVITVLGRLHPVQILYPPKQLTDYLDASVVTSMQIIKTMPPGDILVFLTGQQEIEQAAYLLKQQTDEIKDTNVLICPIFAALPAQQQALVFDQAPPNTRKVILATNIAETSITITGIKYVVDCGMVKRREFNPKTGTESLAVLPISQASANQRSGRAGRDSPGTCYRLYPEQLYLKLDKETEPEIKRCNLASAILILKASGIDDITKFDFLDRPSHASLVAALEELYALTALNSEGQLSALGKKMSIFPLSPPFARVLLASQKLRCTSQVITIISMLSVDVFVSTSSNRDESAEVKKKFAHPEGDLLMLLTVYNEYLEHKDAQWCRAHFLHERNMRQAKEIRDQLVEFCEQLGIDASTQDTSQVVMCFLTGFFRNVALRNRDGSYTTLNRQQVWIHPSSLMFNQKAECVMFIEAAETTRSYLRNVSIVLPNWLHTAAPHYYQQNSLMTIKRN